MYLGIILGVWEFVDVINKSAVAGSWNWNVIVPFWSQ